MSRRCLLPADGFFEWWHSEREKQPFHFGMQDDSLFAFAGLWDRWRNPAGTVIESCSIITTTPNSLLADIHDRMPVILRQETYDLWLDPGFKDVKALAEVLLQAIAIALIIVVAVCPLTAQLEIPPYAIFFTARQGRWNTARWSQRASKELPCKYGIKFHNCKDD
jgi:putative SOS response-associated peptidase YedK